MESQEVIRRKNKDEKFESEDEHKEDIKDDKSNEGSEEEQIINRIEFKTVDDAYDKIKGNNRFTWFYAAPVGLVYCFSPVYVIPYMKQIPAVECSFNGGTTWSSCSKDYVCNSYSAATYRYDYDSISTVDNWITKMDLICITDFQIGLLGTLFFVGWVIGALTLLSLGDIIGRKKVLLFSATGFIFMACGLVIVDKLWLLYINLLLLGIFQGCKGALAYLYMLELAPLYMRPLLHMYGMIIESVAEVCGAFLIWNFQNGFFVILLLICINACCIISVVFAPESPKFLFASKRWNELHKTLNYIAKFNGVEEWNGKFDEENHIEHHSEEQLGFFEILKITSIRTNLLIMALNWSCCSCCFYIVAYSMNKFKGNVYANGLMFGLADLTGGLMSVMLMIKLRFK